jgi:hypothetical protein
VATGLESTAAIASLATRLPGWVLSAVLVGVPLLTFSFHEWKVSRQLRDQVIRLYHYDRKYELHSSQWVMRKSTVHGYWDATNYSEREFTCLNPMRSMKWEINRRTDDDMPFVDHPPALRDCSVTRSGDGVCVFREPHKSRTSLAFRVEFDPMLRPGEEVSVKWELDVPVYKPGTLEMLRKRPAPQIPPPGEVEFTTTDCEYPIQEFVKEVVIPDELMSSRHGVQVLRRHNELTEEQDHLRDTDSFKIFRSTRNGVSVWVLRIQRHNPPIKAAYRIYWQLPHEDALM